MKTTNYYIAMRLSDNGMGFGYQTKAAARKLWDGRRWTTDKSKAIKFENNPKARIFLGRLIANAEIITL